MKKGRWRLITLCCLFLMVLLITSCSINLTEGKTKTKEQKQKHFPAFIETLESLKPGNTLQGSTQNCLNPKVIIGSECCLDENKNNICDKVEAESSCGDGICSPNENSCTCTSDCGTCETEDAGVCQHKVCENYFCVIKTEAQCCGDNVCDSVTESCGTCFQDCCTIAKVSSEKKRDLENYPAIGVGLSTVVGDKAPPQDVVIAGDILTHIASEDKSVGKGKLASEITLTARDYIVVGNPCDNKAAYALFKKEIKANNQNCQIFQPGEALVKIFPTSTSTIAIYVGGYTPLETELAAKQLIKYKKYEPEGSEVRI